MIPEHRIMLAQRVYNYPTDPPIVTIDWKRHGFSSMEDYRKARDIYFREMQLSGKGPFSTHIPILKPYEGMMWSKYRTVMMDRFSPNVTKSLRFNEK